MLEHVVLIGLNFQPSRSTGDKNFWVNLIPLISSSLKRITILSIRKHHIPEEQLNIDDCLVNIKYISPKLLESSGSKYTNKKIFWKEGAYPHWLGVIEKWLQFRTILKELSLIYDNHPYQCVHLMDNMGIINRLMANRLPAPVSVSAMSYQAKNPRWLYLAYIHLSYKHRKLTIIPYSQSFADKLLDLGLESKNVHRIPWGVHIPTETIINNNKKLAAKEKLGLSKIKPVILWAGYIQQIAKQDFLFAYEIAKKAQAKGINAIFSFAFKPESFENEFKYLHKPDSNIFVAPTTVDEFKLFLEASDVLFSPVINSRCILAPPLTWVEIMSKGKPIISTNVSGADEIIENGETGAIATNEVDLILKIESTVRNAERMQQPCVKKIERDYNIVNTANLYLDIWRKSYEVHSKQSL